MPDTLQSPDANGCQRCGQCCRNGGPVLHRQDLILFERGVLAFADLVTLRAGELAVEPAAAEPVPLDQEAVKLAPRPGAGWTCRKLDPESGLCRIHPDRPAECRALDCRRPRKLLSMYRQDRIVRADLLGEDHPLLELARTLDQGCPPGRVRELAMALRQGGRQGEAELGRMLRLDLELRRLAVERGVPESLLPLLLGRPQGQVLRPLGLAVRGDPDRIRIREIPIQTTRSAS